MLTFPEVVFSESCLFGYCYFQKLFLTRKLSFKEGGFPELVFYESRIFLLLPLWCLSFQNLPFSCFDPLYIIVYNVYINLLKPDIKTWKKQKKTFCYSLIKKTLKVKHLLKGSDRQCIVVELRMKYC